MRKIFIDGGACQGNATKFFLNLRQDAKDYEIFTFEPNPRLAKCFKGLPTTHFQKAIWTHDGEINFYVSKRIVSSTAMLGKTTGKIDYSKPTVVECIDFDKWIKTSFSFDDYIVVKLNIEGAEYPVLESMLDSSLALIDELAVEFHWKKLDCPDIGARHDRLVSAIQQKGVEIRRW
jgi:FkbM family methyltransferase